MLGFDFLTGIPKQKNKINRAQQIADNLEKIIKYLQEPDIFSLKLTCRPFYYYFVTAELWIGLKLNVAEEKLQHLQDLQFQQAETKQITRKDKNIRINSLKKQNEQRLKKLPKRQSSNIKQKAKNINQHNQLLFRNTEIGFKRLMKTNSKKKIGDFQYEIKDIGDLPKVGNLADFVIRINDPWSTNMTKAQNIINLFKKVNEFHHKFLAQIKLPSKQVQQLLSKLAKSQQKAKVYHQTTSIQPYTSLISSTEGCKQNLLIDDQLNKVCRLFWNYHQSMQKIYPQMTQYRQILQKQKSRIQTITKNIRKKVSVEFVQNLSNIDQSIEIIVVIAENNKELGQILVPQLIGIYYVIIDQLQQATIIFQDTEEQVKVQAFSWSIIAKRPYFSETVFQILASLNSKIIKLSTSMCPDDITLSITINKLKAIKSVSQSLLNIAKYFGKLKKQLQQKEKKGKDSKIAESIKQFLDFYQNKVDQVLYLTKNSGKLQKIVAQFKQNISSLKSQLQNNGQ